jgi:hypothetical protein
MTTRTFRSQTINLIFKSRFDLLVCRWCATYHWKDLNEGYNFVLYFTLIKSLQKKLWAFKIARITILKISRLPTKWHLDVILVVNHKKYYKRKVMTFSKSELWWILWVCACLGFVYAPKMLQLCINQLVFWFVQICVNNWFIYHLF